MKIRSDIRQRLTGRLHRQAGFTFVSSFVSFVVAGAILTGGWMAYTALQVQTKVANADRMMDQYAHSAFQELTNLCSWSWAGVEVQGGSRNTRWKFLTQDVVQEHGTRTKYTPDLQGFVFLSYHPLRGILINNQPPEWAEQYVFVGTNPRFKHLNNMDRRDRMTMTSLTLEHAGSRFLDQTNIGEIAAAKGTVIVKMTLQYRYDARALFGMYPEEYVREREYETQIFLRNWESSDNEYRKQWMEMLVGTLPPA